jgi:hypothetical protein
VGSDPTDILNSSIGERRTDEVLMLLANLPELEATDPISMIVPLDHRDATLNQRGGVPRGVSAATWPRTDRGKPLQYLFTLDLLTLPVLRKEFPDARAVALFLDDVAGDQRGRSRDNFMTIATVALAEADCALPALTESPAEVVMPECGFAVVPAVVPTEVWTPVDWNTGGERKPLSLEIEGKLERLEHALRCLVARCGGRALYLHSNLDRGDSVEIVMQFDERFIDGINLGDGVAYWYGNAMQWQC